MGREILSL